MAESAQMPGPGARYHALDALRASMMLLGLVFHTLCSYVTFPMGDTWLFQDRATARWVDVVFMGLHVFRMPVFMVLGGFFAALLVERRGEGEFLRNRALRIALPLVFGYLVLSPVTRLLGFFAQARQSGAPSGWGAALERASASPYIDNIMHLWFLWFLVLFYALSLGLRRALPARSRAEIAGLFHRAFAKGRGLAFLPFVVASSALATFMEFGVLATSETFLPSPLVLGVYACFFFFGWLLYGERRDLPRLQASLWTKGASAVLFWAVHLGALIASSEVGNVGVTPLVALSATSGMLSGWISVAFCIGVALRFFSSESPALRYVTDASYWVYLVHVPLVFLMGGVITPLDWSALPKAAFVLTTVTALSLASYAVLVRRTWLGQWLNGRKYT